MKTIATLLTLAITSCGLANAQSTAAEVTNTHLRNIDTEAERAAATSNLGIHAFMRTVLDDVDAISARATLGAETAGAAATAQAFAIQRGNHTGTQLGSTISDATTAATANTLVKRDAGGGGVNVYSASGTGITGSSFDGTGITGTSDSGTAIAGYSESGIATDGSSGSGTGINGYSTSGTGITGNSFSGDHVNFGGGKFIVANNGATTLTSTIAASNLISGLGSAATPSYTFTGDLNTGVWSPAADTLAVSTNGVERMRVDATGITAKPAIGFGADGAGTTAKWTNVTGFGQRAELKFTTQGGGVQIYDDGAAIQFGTTAGRGLYWAPATRNVKFDDGTTVDFLSSSPYGNFARIVHNGTHGVITTNTGDLLLSPTGNVVVNNNLSATGTVTGSNLVYNTGAQTVAGAKTLSGQLQLTGQAATDANSAMTRGLADTRYYQTVIKFQAADLAVTSSTALVDTDLTFDVVSGATYSLETNISYTVAGTFAGGVKEEVSNTATTSLLGGYRNSVDGQNFGDQNKSFPNPFGLMVPTTTRDFAVTRRVVIFTTTSAGTIKIQFSQWVSDAGATTIKAGSQGKLIRIN